MRSKKKKSRSLKKYWIILVCWFISPAVLITMFRFPFGFAAAIVFALLYWIFVMLANAYEHFMVLSYLEKHYPYEVKRVKEQILSTGLQSYWSYFNANDPPNDNDWKEAYGFYHRFSHFLYASVAAVFCFCLLYGIWGGMA